PWWGRSRGGGAQPPEHVEHPGLISQPWPAADREGTVVAEREPDGLRGGALEDQRGPDFEGLDLLARSIRFAGRRQRDLDESCRGEHDRAPDHVIGEIRDPTHVQEILPYSLGLNQAVAEQGMVQGRPERSEGLVGSVMPVRFALPWVQGHFDMLAAIAKHLLEIEGTTEHMAGAEHPP